MELLAIATVLSFLTSEVASLQCYQCFGNPMKVENDTTPNRMCDQFDYSDKYVVNCPDSTMCLKQEVHLNIQNGEKIISVIRDCASQTQVTQNYANGRWYKMIEFHQKYEEGCFQADDKGERATSSWYCYCRKSLCNSSPKTNHEGYTDIMGVIVVFNLMKYINSLR